jgi:hypothetical protein
VLVKQVVDDGNKIGDVWKAVAIYIDGGARAIAAMVNQAIDALTRLAKVAANVASVLDWSGRTAEDWQRRIDAVSANAQQGVTNYANVISAAAPGIAMGIKSTISPVLDLMSSMNKAMSDFKMPKMPDSGAPNLSGGGGAGRREADRLKREAKEIKEQIQEAKDEAYKATHSDYDNQIYDAKKKYADRVSYDPDNKELRQQALNEYMATRLKLATERFDEFAKHVRENGVEAAKKVNEALTAAGKQMGTLDQAVSVGSNAIATAIQEDHARRVRDLLGDVPAMVRGYQEMAKGAADAAKEAAKMEDNKVQYEREHNLISLKDYRALLAAKLSSLQRFSDEWMKVQREIDKVDQDIAKAKPPTLNQQWKHVLIDMRDQAEHILVDDLGNALQHGFKGFFKTILQQFEQMLAQMAAQALVSGIFSLLSGGNFLGGALGGLVTGGFDDGANDRSAVRWGRDFGALFSGGVADGARSARGISSTGGSTGGPAHVEVHMYGPHNYGSGMDVKRVADQIGQHLAYSAQTRLRTVVGS